MTGGPHRRRRGKRGSDMHSSRIIFWALCIAGCASLAGTLSATVVVPAEFGEMVAASQTIVHGRVVDVRAQMSTGRRSIESIVTVQVASTLKGERRSEIVLRLPSGRVGRYRRITAGAPELTEGDEVVLFLEGRSPAVPMPFGLTQGVYRVLRQDGAGRVTPTGAAGPGRRA